MKNKILLINLLGLLLLLIAGNTTSAQNTLTTDTVIQTSTCVGGQLIIQFTATGTFNSGNKFTAQLSDPVGQFTAPVNIGSPIFGGYILATIPTGTGLGIYKIRVVSSSPAIIGTTAPNNIYVTSFPQLATITASPNDTVCKGDTITLSVAVPNQTYLWSTGETTQSIKVVQPGSYRITLTDIATCVSKDTINITTKTCVSGIGNQVEDPQLVVYPNPFSSYTVFYSSDLPFQDGSLSLFNHLGQLVLVKGQIQGDTFKLETMNLFPGLYFYHLQINKEVRKKGKLFLE